MQFAEMTLSEIRQHLNENTNTFEKISLIQETASRVKAGEKLHSNVKYASETAQTILMDEHAGYIKMYAKKYIVASQRSQSCDFDDTIQEAKLGFLRAIQKYDVTKGIGETPLHVLAHYYMTEALHLHANKSSSRPDPFRNKTNRVLRDKIIGHKRKGLSLIESYELLINQADEKVSPTLILTCVQAIYEQFAVTVAEEYSEEEITESAYVSEALLPAENRYSHQRISDVVREATTTALSELPSLVRVAYLFKRGFDHKMQPLEGNTTITNKEIANVLFDGGMTGDDGKSPLTSEAVRMMFKRIDQTIQAKLASGYKIKTLAEIV